MKDLFWNHRYPILLSICTFLLIFLFFAQAHPLYPYDADDWTYLYHTREMYPSIEEYNPTRILPEILMPFSGELAMSLIYPLTGDITIAVGITASFILAILITAYLLLFYRMLRKLTKTSAAASILLSLLFLALHFLVFRTDISGNQHLFYSFDLCCHYNYTIPNLLAACMVFLFMTDKFEDFDLHSHLAKKGLLLLGIFLVIFSHVFGSIILIAYLGTYLLFQTITAVRKKESPLRWVRRYVLHISAIIIWLIALVFEINGRRADNVMEIASMTFEDSLKDAIHYFLQMTISKTNHLFVGLLLFAYIIFACLAWKKKSLGPSLRHIALILCSTIICSIYLVLMGAKSYPYYLLRAMTIFAVPFFLMVGAMLCSATMMSRYPKWSAFLPFLLFLVYCDIEQKGDTFMDVQTLEINQKIQGVYRVHPQEILKQNRQYIRTLVEADKNSDTYIDLEVPKFDHADNWPLAYYYGKRLSRFLYKYGVIKRTAKVTIVPKGNNQETTIEETASEE